MTARSWSSPWWAFATPVLFGVVTVLYVTRHGVLFDPDSEGYLRAARRMAADPLAYFGPASTTDLTSVSVHPPFYSLLISLLGRATGQLQAARLINVAAAAVTAAAIVEIVRQRSSALWAAGAALAVLGSRGIIFRLHGFMMSDAVFLALAVASLALIDAADRATSARRYWAHLTGAAVCASCACSTRLDGAALVATIAVAAWTRDAPTTQRRRSLAVIGAVATLPIGAWIVSQALNAPDRNRFGIYPIRLSEVTFGFRDVVRNLLPEAVVVSGIGTAATVVLMVVFLVGVPIGARAIARRRHTPNGSLARLSALLGTYALGHTAFMVTARLVADPFISFDARHLAPTWVALVMLAAIWLASCVPSRGKSVLPAPMYWGATATAVLLVAFGVTSTSRSLVRPGAAWGNLRDANRVSVLVDRARAMPTDRAIYSNRVDVIYLLADREVRPLPVATNPMTGDPNPFFDDDLRRMVGELRDGDGVVMLVDDGDRLWTPDPADLVERTGLTLVETIRDGPQSRLLILRCTATCQR